MTTRHLISIIACIGFTVFLFWPIFACIKKQAVKDKRGFWSLFFEWWRTPYSLRSHFSRGDTRIAFFLAIAAIIFVIFGGSDGLVFGIIALWYISTLLIPEFWMESFCRRLGPKLGMIIVFAPWWLPIVMLLSEKLWMPMLGIH